MKKYKTLIFDFDGTIADSLGVLIRVYSSLSEEFSLKELSPTDIERLRNMAPQEILKFLNIPLFRLPFLLFKGRSKYKDFLEDVEPFAGIPYVLIQLQKKYHMHILTSNTPDIVMAFLQNHGLSCFDTVMSEKNIFGKEHSLNKMIKQLELKKEEILYIGDEVRDIHSCQNAGIDIVSVAWGLNSKQILEKAGPTYLITKPDDLLAIL